MPQNLLSIELLHQLPLILIILLHVLWVDEALAPHRLHLYILHYRRLVIFLRARGVGHDGGTIESVARLQTHLLGHNRVVNRLAGCLRLLCRRQGAVRRRLNR